MNITLDMGNQLIEECKAYLSKVFAELETLREKSEELHIIIEKTKEELLSELEEKIDIECIRSEEDFQLEFKEAVESVIIMRLAHKCKEYCEQFEEDALLTTNKTARRRVGSVKRANRRKNSFVKLIAMYAKGSMAPVPASRLINSCRLKSIWMNLIHRHYREGNTWTRFQIWIKMQCQFLHKGAIGNIEQWRYRLYRYNMSKEVLRYVKLYQHGIHRMVYI